MKIKFFDYRAPEQKAKIVLFSLAVFVFVLLPIFDMYIFGSEYIPILSEVVSLTILGAFITITYAIWMGMQFLYEWLVDIFTDGW